MKIIIIVITLNFICSNVYSQTVGSNISSIFSYFHNSKEAEKESGLTSGNVSLNPLLLNINSKDKQIDVRNSYILPLNGNSTKKKIDFDLNFGLSLAGKMDNSITSVFKDNNLVGGFKGGGLISLRLQQSSKVFVKDTKFQELFSEYHNAKIGSEAKRNLEKKILNYTSEKLHNATYWLYASSSLEGRNFFNIDSLNQTDFIKRNNTLYSYSCGFSTFQNNLPLNFMGLIDLSISIKNQDNFSDLKELSSYKQFSNGTVGNRLSFTSYLGEYNESIESKQVSLGAYLVNKNLPLFGIYINPTYEFQNELYSPSFDLNYVIYFLSPKVSVLSPNFGLIFSHKDMTGNRGELYEDENSRFSIGIVTRLNIGNWFN